MPLNGRACWSLHGKRLDVGAMNDVARMLEGVHDFSLFGRNLTYSSGQEQRRIDKRSPIRCLQRLQVIRMSIPDPVPIESATLVEDSQRLQSKKDSKSESEIPPFGELRIIAEADFFLWNMCRRLVGLLVQVGLHSIEISDITKHLGTEVKTPMDNSIKAKFVVTAPAKGLCLESVMYDGDGVGSDPSMPSS